MKPTKLIITFLAPTAYALRCKPSEEQFTSGQIDKLKPKTNEAAQDMKDYSYAEKAFNSLEDGFQRCASG